MPITGQYGNSDDLRSRLHRITMARRDGGILLLRQQQAWLSQSAQRESSTLELYTGSEVYCGLAVQHPTPLMQPSNIVKDLVSSDPELSRFVIDALKLSVLLVCRDTLRIRFRNNAFQLAYGDLKDNVLTSPIRRSGGKRSRIDEQETTLAGLIRELDKSQRNTAFEAEFAHDQSQTVCIKLLRLNRHRERLALITIENITRRKHAEQMAHAHERQLVESVDSGRAELESANRDLKKEISGREQIEAALLESEKALLLSREQLRHLSASLMNAQDSERRRVARELHDDLSQKVAKLQFDAETLEKEVPFEDIKRAKERLRDVGQQAAVLSGDLRRVAHQLHPATLEYLGLSIALQSYAEEFTRSTTIPVKVTSIDVPRKLPIEVSSGLFRIVQEALRNVAKHSNNAKVEIVLAKVPEGLALFVRDDGDGFDLDAARAKGGLGLISIQERVRLIEGKLSIETSPGEGVLLRVQCPISGKKK